MTCEAHRLTSRPLAAFLALLPALLLWAAPAPAFALEVPPLKGRVNDLAGMLSPTQAAALERKLAEYEKGSGHQFALLTVPSLEGDSLEDFSIRVVEKWKLGSKDADDGLLMLVALQDRKMRIEVGYGLEGDIPDAIASRIVRNVLRPAFAAQDYYAGIDQAFDLLIRAAGGESVTIQDAPQKKRSGPPLFILFVVLFFAYRFLGPGGLFLMMGMGGRGGGYGGGGGGGFGGFSGGGGGFGGGGASGDW